MRLAGSPVVAVKFGPDVRHQDTGRQFLRIDDINAQYRVLIGTGVNGCVLGADLLSACQVAATNIHEGGVLMEKPRESIHVMVVPRAGEARGKFTRNIRLTHS